MTQIKHTALLVLITLVCYQAKGQEIITADGYSMGAKSAFMDVCIQNMGSSMPESALPYSVYGFCNCMADELIPTYTKSQINYYFTQGHMEEMFSDKTSYQIILSCINKNLKEGLPTMPPDEYMAKKMNQPLIDSLISICNYEDAFNQIKKRRVAFYTSQNNWSDQKTIEINKQCSFETFERWRYYAAYVNYTKEDLISVTEYFQSMSPEDLKQCAIKHEKIILNHFEYKINYIIEKLCGIR